MSGEHHGDGQYKMLGMPQAGCARYLGISARTARRYVLGEAMILPVHSLLLRCQLANRIVPVVPRWNKDQN